MVTWNYRHSDCLFNSLLRLTSRNRQRLASRVLREGWLVDSTHKGSLIPKGFQCLDVIMSHDGKRLRHDDVTKWKHFPRYWPFVWGVHRWPVNSPHKGQWRGTLMLSLISAWTNGWLNNRDAGDLRRQCDHYDITIVWPRRKFILRLWQRFSVWHVFCGALGL